MHRGDARGREKKSSELFHEVCHRRKSPHMRAHLRMIFLLCDFPLHAGCTAGGQKTSCSEKTTKPNRWKSVRPRSRLRKTRDAGIYCRIRLIVCRPRSPMTGRAVFFQKVFSRWPAGSRRPATNVPPQPPFRGQSRQCAFQCGS